MKILIVNPNTSQSMTQKIAITARAIASPNTEIIATTSKHGPASIQGYFDAAICLAGLLEEVACYPQVDAIVIACFDDTGVNAVRCAVNVPVIGIGEAAYHMASIISQKFSVITTLSRSVAGLEANLLQYGFDKKCVRVRASDIPVLKLEEGDPETVQIIADQISRAIDEDQAEAIVLGCAGMTELVASLSEQFKLPIIDGVASGIALAEALVRAGLTTSKRNSYAGSI